MSIAYHIVSFLNPWAWIYHSHNRCLLYHLSYYYYILFDITASLESAHCVLHMLDLAVNDGVLDQSRVKSIVSTCSSIVSYLHRSSKGTENFINKQMEVTGKTRATCLVLHGYVKTRWNSVYLMLKRFISLKHTVQLFLPMERIKVHGATNVDVKLDDGDFLFMGKVCKILLPFFELTKEFSANKISIAEVIPKVLQLKTFLEEVKAEQVSSSEIRIIISSRNQQKPRLSDSFYFSP